MDKRIGAQGYTVRDLCKDREGFISTIKSLSKIGYKAFQLSGIGPVMPPEEMKKVCDDNGIEIVVTHKGLADYEEKFGETVDFHKKLGVKIAGLGSFPNAGQADMCAAKGEEYIARLNRIAKDLADEGLEFAYHNHAFEFARLDNGKCFYDMIIEEGKFSLISDVYWYGFAGFDPAKKLCEYGDRVAVIHYKDLRTTFENKADYSEVGLGNLDFDSIVKASSKARYAMVEQDFCQRPPLESLEISYKYLTGKYDFI